MGRIPGRCWLLACLILLLWAGRACAESVDDVGLWNVLMAQGDFDALGCESGRLKWWFDGQLRLLEDTDGYNQALIRPGVGWTLNEHSTIWAGYAWINTQPVSGSDFDENRIWQQWTWSTELGAWKLGQRARFEQRFVETGDDLGLRYRQQFRAQRSLASWAGTSLVFWDEVFYNLNDTDWGAQSGFDQNRAFAGIGFKPQQSDHWSVEIGYLNQVIEVATGNDRSHHILSLNLVRSP